MVTTLAPSCCAFSAGVDCYVSGTGDDDGLACDVNAVVLQHFFGEIQKTVAGSLGSCQRSAVGQAFSGENALIQAL